MTKRVAKKLADGYVQAVDHNVAQANEIGSQLHDAVTSESSVYDPLRP